MKLLREFYARDTVTVARELLGMHVVHATGGDGGRRRTGRIVETEAYTWPHDRASHSFRGITARNAVMFGPPGHSYVYMIYGFWFCLNFVTEPEGTGCAVLLRAVEPLEGIDDKTWGPGLLCRAMDIDKKLNGVDLDGDVLWLEEGSPVERIGQTTRIGVDYAGRCAKRPWRFFDRDSAFVSRRGRLQPRLAPASVGPDASASAKRPRAGTPDTKRSRSSR